MTGAIAFVALVGAWTVGGLLLGTVYFAAVRRTADLFSCGRSSVMPAVLTLSRLVAAALCFAAAARYGALPLLGAFLGFLVARGVALRGLPRAG